MSKARALGEQGVSVVLGAILVFGIIIGAVSIIYPMYVRNTIRDKEVEHSRVVGEKFAELKSKIEDMGIGESRTVIMPTSRGQATLVPSSGTLGAISVYPSAFTIYGGWRQTKWSLSTSPNLQSGPWDITYENFYESENVEIVENDNITLQAGKTSGSLTSSVCDATTDIRWGVVNWSDYIPVKIENYSVQDEPTSLIDGTSRLGENLGSYLQTWAQDNDYENIREADENIQAKFLYVENYENYKGRVENFSYMKENNPATYATLIERAHSGTYAQENPILNGTFTSSAASWTYAEVDPKGFASGSYDGSTGNPPPGSDKGSYGFRYQDTDGACQIHYFRSDNAFVNGSMALWLGDTLTGATPGVISRPSIPPGLTIFVGEWTTNQLGVNKIPAGTWTFKYWGFRTSDDNTGSAQLQVNIYRRTSAGELKGIAENVAAAPLGLPPESEVTGTYYMPEQGMSADNKDAIVIRVYAKNTSSIAQTVYFFFSFSDWPSRMISTISVPLNDMMRISQTFTAPAGTYVGNISAKFAFKLDNVSGIENARFRVIYLIRNSADTSTVRTMYDSGWKTDNKAWDTYYDNLIPTATLTPGTSYIIRVEVQVYNPNKWERPRVWVNVDDISLTFTIQRYDMDIGFNIKDVSTDNNYLEMRYKLDNLNDQFRVWVYDFSKLTWSPRGENLTGLGIASWQDDFEDGNIDGWVTGGNANWATTTGDKHSGTYSAKAGTITHSQNTWIKTIVTGPGRLMWWWKVSSESGWDYLRFYLDGVEKSKISGTVAGWQSMNWDIPSGSHEIKFQYDKDGVISSGQDTGWIDDLKLVGPAWTFWSYQLGENEVQAGQVKLRIVDVDNMAKLATNVMIDFIRIRSGGLGYRLRWGHLFTGVPVTGSYQIKIYGWANSGENVGVYVWEPSTSSWSPIGNLPTSPGWVVQMISIADYVVGNDLWIKYEDVGRDHIQNEIHIDYCVLEGEIPLEVKITVEVRTGRDSDPRDGGWGDWENISKGSPIVGPYIRFLQYRVTMWTANPAWMPFLYEISIGVEEMGSIEFEVKNLIYPDQAWLYEGGGVILSQYDLNAMRSDPPLITIREVENDKIEVLVNKVTIENFPVSYTSSVPVTVTVTVKDIYYDPFQDNREEVIVQVGSSYPNAWTSYFSKLVERYKDYNASFDNNTLSLTIKGKNPNPGVYDIIYSKKVKVIEISFG